MHVELQAPARSAACGMVEFISGRGVKRGGGIRVAYSIRRWAAEVFSEYFEGFWIRDWPPLNRILVHCRAYWASDTLGSLQLVFQPPPPPPSSHPPASFSPQCGVGYQAYTSLGHLCFMLQSSAKSEASQIH
jgi:hypothetical protein